MIIVITNLGSLKYEEFKSIFFYKNDGEIDNKI